MAGVVLGPVDLGRLLVGEDGRRALVVVHERDPGHVTAVELLDGEVGDALQGHAVLVADTARETHQLFDELGGIVHGDGAPITEASHVPCGLKEWADLSLPT